MKKILFMICLFSLGSSFATEASKLPLRGQGQYTWFLLKIYEAKLWAHGTSTGDNIYSGPLVLELKYNRSFKGKDIAEQSIKEIVSSGVAKDQLSELSKMLQGIFPDVKENDVISANFDPKSGIVFHLNQTTELGRITDLNYAKTFLNIWLGEKTSAPELRKKLLGEKV